MMLKVFCIPRNLIALRKTKISDKVIAVVQFVALGLSLKDDLQIIITHLTLSQF